MKILAYLTDQVQFREHSSNEKSKEDFKLSIISVNQAARLYVMVVLFKLLFDFEYGRKLRHAITPNLLEIIFKILEYLLSS